jgi:hypothetical protein
MHIAKLYSVPYTESTMKNQRKTQHIDPNAWLTTTQAAKRRGVPYSTLISWITRTKRRLPAQFVDHPRGGYYLILAKEVDAYVPVSRGGQPKQPEQQSKQLSRPSPIKSQKKKPKAAKPRRRVRSQLIGKAA